MNRLKIIAGKHMLLFLIMCIFILQGVGCEIVQGESWSYAKKLEENKSYYFDLDFDGKKEEIRYKTVYDGYYDVIEMKFYVNNKLLYQVPPTLMTGSHVDWYIMDIDKKDKKLDLFFLKKWHSDGIMNVQFKYYVNGKLYTRKNDKKNLGLNRIIEESIGNVSLKKEGIKTDGKGTVYLPVDTYFQLPAMKQYVAYIPFQVKNNYIQQKKIKSYRLLYGMSRGLKNKQYEINRPCFVYKRANEKSQHITMLVPGDIITIEAIAPNQKEREIKRKGGMTGYAYVKTKDGKKGWIYLDTIDPYEDSEYNRNSSLFKIPEAWC